VKSICEKGGNKDDERDGKKRSTCAVSKDSKEEGKIQIRYE
jgi:hypothetical protein